MVTAGVAQGDPLVRPRAARVPPHDLGAEQSLLGAMLLSSEAIAAAAGVVSAADFYKPAHGHVFDAVHALYAAGQPVDAVTVADELRRAGLLDAVGGPAVLSEILASTPATSNAGRYARIVEEYALLRRLVQVGGEIAEIGHSVPDDVPKALDRAEALVYEVNERRVTDSTRRLSDLLSENLDRLEELQERGEAITGTPTGYLDLDHLLSGLQPSALVVVGARPAMGKCIAWDTPVLDPATGALRSAAEVHRRGRAGEPVTVVSVDDTGELGPARPSAFVDDGRRPVFRVRTASGRTVRTTASHPFLTERGWQPLANLHVGTRIGVPAALAVFGRDPLPDEEVEAIAEVVASTATCAAAPIAVPSLAGSAAASRPLEAAPGPPDVDAAPIDLQPDPPGTDRRRRPAELSRLAARHGVGLDPSARRVPDAVFRLPRPSLARFWRRLLALSGSLWRPVGRGDEPRLVIAAPNETVARQLAHLLLRFGVAGTVRAAVRADDDSTRLDHEVEIRGTAVAALALALDAMAPEDPVPGDQVRGDRASGDCARPAIGGVRWDEVVAIEADGVDQVYDLTVPGLHNFVAGDVLVHNTSFALGAVAHAAMSANRPVLFFSLEMSHLELSQRLLCSEAKVDSQRIRTGALRAEDWQKISAATGRLAEAPIWIDDNPNLSIMEIRAKARRLKSQVGDLGLIVVDYLQLMTSRSHAENRQVEVSELSRGLKILARELEVPVLALSQLSRGLEMRSDKRPMLSDLRESGSIEQDSDVVMFIYRDEVYDPKPDNAGQAEVIVAKHRSGPTGIVQLAFLPQYTRFANMARGFD